LGSYDTANASGLLKEEMKQFDSLLVKAAFEARVPAGQALAVDREVFSKIVTDKLKSMKNIEIINEECLEISKDEYTVIATGPLSSESISEKIKELTKATIRCIPLDREEEAGSCVFTGNPSVGRVLFAKAY
jgi:methylenetetrahydrofolate--tRNA-(uracil-5-)-methyltransferase